MLPGKTFCVNPSAAARFGEARQARAPPDPFLQPCYGLLYPEFTLYRGEMHAT